MSKLAAADRALLVLRFYEKKSGSEAAALLGMREDAAHKRVARAIEKLRKFFAQRGVMLSGAAIAVAVSANSVQAAPVGLAATISATFVKSSVVAASTLTLAKGALKLMAWAKAKTAIVVGVGVLLVAGTTTITVKQIATHKTDDSWRVENITSAMVERAAAQVEILPTKFPLSENYFMLAARPENDKVVGIRVSVADIAWVAYYWSPGRMIFTIAPSQDRYDFISTLPQDSSKALQKKLKSKLGLVGHYETRDVDVLLLKMRNPNAPGLKPPTGDRDFFVSEDVANNAHIKGKQSLHDITDSLEKFLGMPVIDQTGIARNFSIDLQWKELGDQDPNYDALKQALLDQLGLELVPSHQSVEMLVVEKSKD